ncbi:uncharacterized protein LOC143884472 [Tasmannia lanceolata]|uniref:uncharacterized protein LOC143884472 n=1 Tax=Tasmannia lanceolata TaxID=3420 RepID=UPI004064456F
MGSVANSGVVGRMSGLLQHSFNLIKSLSTSTSPTSSAISTSPTSSAVSMPKKSKCKKKKNLFEVVQFLPNWGIGYKMAKNHWIGISYEITKINLYKDGRHGKAWGIFHKDGLPAADAPKKISGVHKRGWRYIPDPKPTVESTPTPRPEVQA